MKHSFTSLCVAVAAASLPAMLGAADLQLASGGKTDYSIVVRPEAPELEKAAAADLKQHLEKITGAKFPMDDSGKFKIYLGVPAPGDGRPMRPAERRIKAVNGDLYLYGANTDGAPFAVYDLLERHLGCRWYTPWGDEKIPRNPELTLPEPDASHTPSFERFDTASMWGFDRDPRVRDYLRRHRIHITPDRIKADDHYVLGFPVHTFCKYIPPGHIPQGKFLNNIGWAYKYFTGKKYFETNPEFFSMDTNGKRVWDRQLCLSNPELRKELTKNLEIVIEKEYRGGDAVISVDMNDKSGYLCKCPGCVALEKKYETSGGPLYDYLIELGEYFAKKHPRIRIRSLAYFSTLPPPNWPLPPNVMMWYAPLRDRNILRTYKTTRSGKLLPDLRQLAAKSSGLWKWFYVCVFNNRNKVPAPLIANVWRIADDLRTLHENKVKAIMTEFGQGGICSTDAFGELRLYLLGELIDDLSRDEDKVVREFMAAYYGDAAEPMYKYLRTLHDLGFKAPDTISGSCSRPWRLSFLTNEQLVKFDRDFDEMEQLVSADPRALMHVRRARRNLDETLMYRWNDLAEVDPARYTAGSFAARKARYTENLHETLAECYRTWEDPADAKKRFEGDIKRHLASIAAAPLKKTDYRPVRPLPPEFAQLPAGRVIRTPFLPVDGSTPPADPQAAFGFTMPGVTYPQLNFRPVATRPIHALPITLAEIRAKTPGKYHYYYLGQFPIPPTGLECGSSITTPNCMAEMFRKYDENTDPERLFHLYISMKYEAPDRLSLDEIVAVDAPEAPAAKLAKPTKPAKKTAKRTSSPYRTLVNAVNAAEKNTPEKLASFSGLCEVVDATADEYGLDKRSADDAKVSQSFRRKPLMVDGYRYAVAIGHPYELYFMTRPQLASELKKRYTTEALYAKTVELLERHAARIDEWKSAKIMKQFADYLTRQARAVPSERFAADAAKLLTALRPYAAKHPDVWKPLTDVLEKAGK